MPAKSKSLKASLLRLEKIAKEGKELSDRLTDQKLKKKKRRISEVGYYSADFQRGIISL